MQIANNLACNYSHNMPWMTSQALMKVTYTIQEWEAQCDIGDKRAKCGYAAQSEVSEWYFHGVDANGYMETVC